MKNIGQCQAVRHRRSRAQRRPPASARAARAGRPRRATTTCARRDVDHARTSRSGTSGTPLLSSSKAAHLYGRRELRVETGKGSSRRLGGGHWRRTVRCAHVDEKKMPRERRPFRVGMVAVHRNEDAGRRQSRRGQKRAKPGAGIMAGMGAGMRTGRLR